MAADQHAPATLAGTTPEELAGAAKLSPGVPPSDASG
jgi:hypothetical protein